MSETSGQLNTDMEMIKSGVTDPDLPVIEVHDAANTEVNQRLQRWSQNNTSAEDQNTSEAEVEDHPTIDAAEEKQASPNTELAPEVDAPVKRANSKKSTSKKSQLSKPNKQDDAHVRMLLERCRHICISLFYREHAPVRSLGFTSSIQGEGKSFFASTTAQVLAHDSNEPVTLIECNWDHPTLHEYFGVPANPGLAEWLRGDCSEDDIRHKVNRNLTVIPAGDGLQDAVKLLNRLSEYGLHNAFKRKNELYIVDLPSIITTGYGSLAAGLPEALVVVVRAQAISSSMLVETCSQLDAASVYGIVLNQVESHIPRWLRQLL